MFNDYYSILEIDINATQEEIKAAFKKQALKWHPDRNHRIDTTIRMQEINEAYLILKDSEARARYNIEYLSFKEYQRRKANQYKESHSKQEKYQEEKKSEYQNFESSDEILNKWMNNARQQAVDLAKQTIEDLKGMVSAGVKAAAKEAGNQFIYQIIISVAILICFALAKGCRG